MIYYLTGKKALTVSSNGTRKLFMKEKAPEGATDYCLAPCPCRDKCIYDVRKIYYGFTKYTIPKMFVNGKLITGKDRYSIKSLSEALKTSPYGRCVYKCDNDVMENQTVSIGLEGGATATHTMTAFSRQCFRRVFISGTKGEIIGSDFDSYFKLNVFGGPSKKIRVGGYGFVGHLGGDSGVVGDFVEYLKTGVKTSRLSTIDTTLESHRIAFAAEESRKSGKTVKLADADNLV